MTIFLAACSEAVVTRDSLPRRRQPIEVPLRSYSLIEVSGDEWSTITSPFRQRFDCRPEGLVSPSSCLHTLRFSGVFGQHLGRSVANRASIVDALLSNEVAARAFGGDVIKRTRGGARYRPRPLLVRNVTSSDESHRDQVLAGLLELGLPIDTNLRIDDDSASLSLCLRDAVAEFTIKTPELEWTALTLMLALPPSREWENKYGERYSFDDLAKELMRRRTATASCCGTHLLYCMSIMLRVDAQYPVLSGAMRQRLIERVRQHVRSAVRRQSPSGAWGANWCGDSSGSAASCGDSGCSETELLVTGHLAECLLSLPPSLAAPTRTLTLAGTWLRRELLTRCDTGVEDSSFCPVTHAAVALRQLRKR